MTTRVAIYARVSTGEQNPEVQLRELRAYAEHRGFPITASTSTRHRVTCVDVGGRQSSRRSWRMHAGAVSTACWCGSMTASLAYRGIARVPGFPGIDFISHTQAIDTTTPMGRLFFHVIGSFAEFERDVIVERVKAGLANARAKGKRLGRPGRTPEPPTASPRFGPGYEPARDRHGRGDVGFGRQKDAAAHGPPLGWLKSDDADARRYRLSAAAREP